eukprot:2574311-Amphidinium_carterae.3
MRLLRVPAAVASFCCCLLRMAAAVGYAAAGVDETVAAGVDVAAAGVDIAAAGVDVAAVGVDVAAAGVDVAAAGVDIAAAGVDVAAAGVDVAAAGVDKASAKMAIICTSRCGYSVVSAFSTVRCASAQTGGQGISATVDDLLTHRDVAESTREHHVHAGMLPAH